MQTITLYDPNTGEFGPIISGHPDDMPAYANFIEGAHDSQTKKLNLQTREVEDKAPPPLQLFELRQRRNELLDTYRWTIMPDSPLSSSCQAQWAAWLQSLHSLLMDVTDPATVVWPEMPGYDYATNQSTEN